MKLQCNQLTCDVLVAGGGMAGVCAAIAAARRGANVVLVHDRPVLGGNASSEIRMHIVGANCSGARKDADSRESGILEELRLEDAVRNPQRSFSVWDLLLLEWVWKEERITLLLNATVDSVDVNKTKITRVHVSRPASEEEFFVEAAVYVDATGDGRLGLEAGAEFRVGQEAKSEYNESLAPSEANKEVLGSTILFSSRKHNTPMPYKPPAWARVFPTCASLPHRPHVPFEYGFWWVEWGGHLDTIKESENIRNELLSIALGVWDHIKNHGDHGADNWALDWVGCLPGKRESRRFIGDYVLRQADLQQPQPFYDEVAYGGWFIDTHPTLGVDSSEKPCQQLYLRDLFGIPLRSLYSRNVENLLMAGRNISASHIAFASTRVMGTCSVVGQAVGTVAAWCAQHNTTPREVAHGEDIRLIQQQLLMDDVFLTGIVNNDVDDHARKATISASSFVAGGEPEKVVNGITRRTRHNTNCWISQPSSNSQWLELRFPQPVPISEVHITFDTNLSGVLTLTASDWYNDKMIKGPQPQTVCDYKLYSISSSEYSHVHTETGNYQRKRIHRLSNQTIDGIRLEVLTTHGDPSVRVFEIRAYS